MLAASIIRANAHSIHLTLLDLIALRAGPLRRL
jgi:hypothetical protein